MANNEAREETNRRIGVPLLLVLGVAVLVAVGTLIMNRSRSADPTLTAAPPIVSTAEHPLTIHTKSPEVLAREMQQDGVAVVGGKPAPPQPRQ